MTGIRPERVPFGNEVATGSRTWFDDLRVDPTARTTGANAPTFAVIRKDAADTSRGVWAYIFDNAAGGSEKELTLNFQMPHGKLLGSPIDLHMHWLPMTDGTAGQLVRWGLEYTWASLGDVFPVTTTVYALSPLIGDVTTAFTHSLTPFAALAPPANEEISSILQCRLFRDSANALDTYTGSVALLSVDAHVEFDRIGSRDEFVQ